MPNLKSVFLANSDQILDVDRATFYSAEGYKIYLSNEYNSYSIEPKVAYRRIKGFDNIIDAGANLDLKQYDINFSGMYHSNKSFTLGLGLNLQAVDVLFAYTNNTSPLTTHANNTFKLGVKLKLFR